MYAITCYNSIDQHYFTTTLVCAAVILRLCFRDKFPLLLLYYRDMRYSIPPHNRINGLSPDYLHCLHTQILAPGQHLVGYIDCIMVVWL